MSRHDPNQFELDLSGTGTPIREERSQSVSPHTRSGATALAPDHLCTVVHTERGHMIPFPLNRRHRKIVQAARTLTSRKTEQGRQRFWDRTINALAAELARHGCDEAEVARQVEAFFRAVERELSTTAPHDEREEC